MPFGKLKFEWSALQVALEGHSYLDVPKLNVSTKADAKQFLFSYGYDLDDPLIREEIWRIYFQAVAFLTNSLLDAGEKLPREFLVRGPQCDVLRLLTEASKGTLHGRWSCALLRIMHIISHLDNDVRLENFSYAREQIFERFDRYLKPDAGRRWKFGSGASAIPLVRCIRKQRKERGSILMKLLSKPHTVVEEIYDSLGFRFVTETRLDAYRLIQVMMDTGAVAPANIQPNRSVNSLIPLDIFKQHVESVSDDLDRGDLSVKAAQKKLNRIEEESLVSWTQIRNPFSSRWYRAIQFTCRQMIVAPDPTFRFWNELREELIKSKSAAAALKKLPITLRERRTFYYPFEIQIMDKESYVESIGGRSRHREYKAKQRLMARNRVLRDLV